MPPFDVRKGIRAKMNEGMVLHAVPNELAFAGDRSVGLG